jgi:precorrin-8X/cobalt-precorrin-8 methylmutase
MSTAPDMALVIAGHGSRDPEGVKQFEAFIEGLRQARPNQLIRHGYLEFARPTIDEAARACVAAGAKRIAVVPGVLLGATHAKNDMPVEVMMLQKEFPGNEFQYGAPLHLHPRVLDACRDRVLETEASSPSSIPRSATCLVIAGRGTTDPDANSDVAKLARILQEGMGFAHSAVCFSGTATPLMPEGLQAVAKTGVRRIIILPFFLFTGVLMKRIATACAETAAAFPKSEFLLCEPLGAHPALLDAFTDRAKEALEGSARSNCGLCKYRTAIVGYEAEAGTPQQAHHGHVRATPFNRRSFAKTRAVGAAPHRSGKHGNHSKCAGLVHVSAQSPTDPSTSRAHDRQRRVRRFHLHLARGHRSRISCNQRPVHPPLRRHDGFLRPPTNIG